MKTRTYLPLFVLLLGSFVAFTQPSCDDSNILLDTQETLSPQLKKSSNYNASLAMSDTITRDSGDIIWLGGYDGDIVHWEISNDYGQTWEVVNQDTDYLMYDSPKSTFYCRVFLIAEGTAYYSNTVIKTVIDHLICSTKFEK